MTPMPAPKLAGLRVDQVGSLLRPAALREAYADRRAGRIDEAALTAAQDQSIRALVARQEEAGLPVVTDGEFRRLQFMQSFAEVAGLEAWHSDMTAAVEEVLAEERADTVTVGRGAEPVLAIHRGLNERLRLLHNRPRDEVTFLRPLTRRPIKTTLIGPDRIRQGFDTRAEGSPYESETQLLDDLVRVGREIIAGVREAGCDYVQIDEPSYTAYVDPTWLERMRARGQDPRQRMHESIAADNALVDAFPETTFGIHICRGNRRSRHHREGAYDAIAEELYGSLRHHRLLLEYDTDRAGSFESLRFVPKGTVAVLGLITTKTGTLERRDDLIRRIDAATAYLPLDQLALSPQCGFASTIEGNLLSEADEWRKLELMMSVAEEVWGTA